MLEVEFSIIASMDTYVKHKNYGHNFLRLLHHRSLFFKFHWSKNVHMLVKLNPNKLIIKYLSFLIMDKFINHTIFKIKMHHSGFFFLKIKKKIKRNTRIDKATVLKQSDTTLLFSFFSMKQLLSIEVALQREKYELAAHKLCVFPTQSLCLCNRNFPW